MQELLFEAMDNVFGHGLLTLIQHIQKGQLREVDNIVEYTEVWDGGATGTLIPTRWSRWWNTGASNLGEGGA